MEDPRLRVVVKEIPILGPTSINATQAALASIAQGKYYPFHVALYAAKGRFKGDKIMRIAQSVGLDTEQLRADIDSSQVKAMIDKNLALAKALGIRGTPGMVVGEEVIMGAIRSKKLGQLLERARA
jgi:protein-disulfide isomerase